QATYTCTDWLSTASNATLLSEEFTVLTDTWQGCSELHAQQCPVTAYEEGGAETRNFYGYTVEDVFERRYSYACVNGIEEDVGGSCQEHLDDGCDYLEDVCLFTNSGGDCASFQRTFSCPTGEGLREETICTGGDGYAVEGVGDTSYAPNEDFGEAYLTVALAGAIGQEIENTDPPGLELFPAENLNCSIDFNSLGPISSQQCCTSIYATSGIGTEKSCSDEEYRLYELRQEERCLHAFTQRSYVNAGFFDWNGYETLQIQQYRCFDTVLGRIIVQAAIEQGILIPFNYLNGNHDGSGASNPGGADPYSLTIDQLTMIDFDHVDLTPAFDFPENFTTNIAEGSAAIAERVASFYGTPDCGEAALSCIGE
nr:conjugal transfer protein TraN [Alphaproteobacteria bacterium]